MMKYTICILLLINHLGHLTNAKHIDDRRGKEGTWQKAKKTSPLPKNAVLGGHESGGSEYPIYVGRWWSDEAGGYLPTSIKSYTESNKIDSLDSNIHNTLRTCYGGVIHDRSPKEFEVLVEPNDDTKYEWVAASNGTVPENAVFGGFNKNAETTYVGRVPFYATINGLYVGKVSPRHHGIFICLSGFGEPKKSDYEVLVRVPK